MTNLFEKAIVFADIHLGLKNNLAQHNDDCIAFLHWAAGIAAERGIKTCLFLGDWHHNRKTVQVATMNASLQGLGILSRTFERTIMLAGNHDLYYKQSRDLDSVGFAGMMPNIEVVVQPRTEGGCGLVPWMVGTDDHDAVKAMAHDPDIRYIFGHFELPGFRLNGVSSRESTGSDPGIMNSDHAPAVYTGHFHKRQSRNNVTYVGSPFAHDFGDTDDDARGLMVLDWDGTREFVDWPDGPKYRRSGYAELCDDPHGLLGAGAVHAQVRVPAGLGWEDAGFIKDVLTHHFGLRKFEMLPERDDVADADLAGAPQHDDDGIGIKSVDELVAECLRGLDDNGSYDKDLLVRMYEAA